MSTLNIYRGETQIAQVKLTGKTMKVGRGKDNDIVLEDPGKGVSRVHAEIRPEGNQYRLVDLQSQNGTWVSGERVASVLLAPGVVAAMGPFRVALNATSPKTQAGAIVIEESVPDTGTEISLPSRMPPPVAAPPPSAESAPTPSDAPPSVAASVPVAPPLPTPPAAKSADRPRVTTPPPAPRPAAKPSGSAPPSSKLWLFVAAAVLVLVSGIGAYFLVARKQQAPVWDATVATTLVESGRCQEALDQQINRALAADPGNQQALQLKARCAAPPTPVTSTVPPVVAVTDPNATKLDTAESDLTSNSCQAALDAANQVLAADPNHERAKAVQQKANDCLKAAAAAAQPATPTDPVVRVAPGKGGLEPVPGETGTQYKARVANVRKKYDDAVAQLAQQHYQQASKELDALVGQVPDGYLDLAQRRAEARRGMSEEAARAYAAAQQADQRSDWNTAIAQYQRAHDLDGRDVNGEIARINETKLRTGNQLCTEADGAFALFGLTTEVAAKYTRALDLLPSTDPCVGRAKERLGKKK